MFVEFAAWLAMTSLSVGIQSTGWIIPLVQSIHILTIGIVFVSLLMICGRVLGITHADQAIGAVLERYSPWIRVGLVVMTVTGVTLVIAEPIREFTSLSFWLKMGLLAVCIASAVAFRRTLAGVAGVPAEAGEEFSPKTKSIAVATILLWVAIIYLGRAIAYDVEVWGSYSLGA